MPGILGRKIGMTRILQDDGCVIPITVVKCDPNEVTQIKTTAKDGYPALVLGFLPRSKPTKNKKFYFKREFRVDDAASRKLGDKITIDELKNIKDVTVTGVSKGKGFQGTIKRFHFSRGPMSHGSHMHREPGAIGARAKPGRVHRGKKLAGHMGVDTVTLKKVPVVYLDNKDHLVGLKGSIPGAVNSLVIIKY